MSSTKQKNSDTIGRGRKESGVLNIELLIPERLAHWSEIIDLPEGAQAALQGMAARVRDDADLMAAFSAFHEKTAIQGDWHREWSPLPMDPAVVARCGEDASLFYLLAYLSALPYTWEQYRRLDVGMDIFQATMLDFRYYIQDYHDGTGRWGYAMFGWIWRHVTAELFRLGRLQYMLIPFGGGVRAFRRVGASDAGHDGSLPSPLLLAAPEMPLREDGYAWGAGRPQGSDIPPEDETTWRPVFESTPEGWSGHPVSPQGQVRRAPVWLPAAEWELILEPGDTVLDLHIPRRDVFTVDECRASYAQALEFFARTFPDRPHKVLFCHTWIFTPQLQRFLPPMSNLVRFQREFYLYPNAGTAGYLWAFVFGGHPDPATAPRDTSLRRTVLDWLSGGGEIFDLAGLMFHGPAEWGTQPYWENAE